MSSAVALLSGGLDSGVALAAWLAGGGTVSRCLTFDYGQRSAAREAAAAAALARRFEASWRLLELPWLGELAARSGSALVADAGLPLPATGTLEQPGDQDSARAVWVPARNTVFLAVAAAWAEACDAAVVLAGFNREEAATFGDNSPAFVAAAEALLSLGTRTGVRVTSPTLAMDKAEVVAAARRFGLGPDDFWSCYRGDSAPCGSCESCLRSRRAWQGSDAP